MRITKIAEPGQRAHMGDLRGRALPRGMRGVLSKVHTRKNYGRGVFLLLGMDLLPIKKLKLINNSINIQYYCN